LQLEPKEGERNGDMIYALRYFLYNNRFVVITFGVSIFILLFFRPIYRRMNAEQSMKLKEMQEM
jgi:hypothetical protein